MSRTTAVLVVSAVASIGLVRSRRWAWWLAVVLDSVVVARCVYEIGWGEWDMWSDGRSFTNAQDVALGSVFLVGLICLVLSRFVQHQRPQHGVAAAKI